MSHRHYTRTLCWVFSCFFALMQWFGIVPAAIAQTTSAGGLGDSELPTVLSPIKSADGSGVANVLLPDWESITFNTLPPIQQAGALDLSQQTKDVGYDLSRRWQAGMTPDQYLKLGDLSQSLRPQAFTLGTIAQTTGLDLDQVSLNQFALLGVQTIAELAAKVPFLKNLPIREIAPIAALLLQKSASAKSDQSLGQALETDPKIGEYRLGDINLEPYSISSIPNLDSVQLGDLAQWQNAFLADIPGLGDVPLTQFPTPLTLQGGVVDRIDMIYGPAEASRNRTISGSKQAGFAVPCREKCAYIELDDVENSGRSVRAKSEGHQWISGKYQLVPGGNGVLGSINNGMEPTGRHPYGDAFKVVVWEPDETTDTVDTAMFFRYCHDFLGCTPYFIGPVPFFTYHRDSMIFVGVLDAERPSQTASQPTEATRTPGQPAGTARSSVQKTCSTATRQATVVPGLLKGIDLSTLQSTIGDRESSGDYSALGTYGCDQTGLCGRALGRYQFMNYNEYASNVILEKPNGQQFLDRVRDGAAPTPDEMMQFFPPADQERAQRDWFQHLVQQASSEVDPKTGQPFQGLRLIERVGQMHYGGEFSPIDAAATQEYGSDIARRYQASQPKTSAATAVNAADPGCVSAPRTVARTSKKVGAKKVGAKKVGPKKVGAKKVGPKQPDRGQATGRYTRPVDAPITSGFGYRIHPISGEQRFHSGIDFGAEEGTAIRAADGGRVVEVMNECTVGDRTCGGGYGNYIVIDHGNGRTTLYGHVMANSVPWRVGNRVNKGEMVARVGTTGNSTGPHLHFETQQDGQPVDPTTFGL